MGVFGVDLEDSDVTSIAVEVVGVDLEDSDVTNIAVDCEEELDVRNMRNPDVFILLVVNGVDVLVINMSVVLGPISRKENRALTMLALAVYKSKVVIGINTKEDMEAV